ncbi:MAG: class I SAM-dependent methyltransferase [Spirochaetales bacterium]|nr:class I SAM-dependent methyltransferase [Spirochaetales bacterium]
MNTQIERFSGFSDLYHKARPVPPEKVCSIILNYLNRTKARAVVDLGSGTGLSAAVWRNHAKTITGIEPNADMRAQAAAKYRDISFIDATAEKTGLDGNSADVITCSQSFHWMEPAAVLSEAGRILQEDGIFAVYDCIWPVSISSASEKAYISLFERVSELSQKYRYKLPLVKQYPKSRHLQNLQDSRLFSYCRQVFFDNAESCDADRFISIALSQGAIQTLLRHSISEIDGEIERFSSAVQADIKRRKKMTVSYSLILGQKHGQI